MSYFGEELFIRCTEDANYDMKFPHSYHNHFDEESGITEEKLEGLCMVRPCDENGVGYGEEDLEKLLSDIEAGKINMPMYRGTPAIFLGESLGNLPYEGGELVKPSKLLHVFAAHKEIE